MNLGIEGKVALVAAGTRGIGLAVAQSLAREGVRVSVCGLSEEGVARTRELLGSSHRVYQCDISRREDIERWVSDTQKDLGRISILVTNTGGPPAGSVLQVKESDWEKGYQSTLLNIVRLVELTAPAMKEAGWGRIVHITSLVARDPNALLGISSTLRAGILALTRLQARELAPYGVTVNGMLPGHTDTDRQTHLLEIRADRNKTSIEVERERAFAEIPMRRFARASEMGDVVTFLCSQQSSYLTGANLPVDGAAGHGLF